MSGEKWNLGYRSSYTLGDAYLKYGPSEFDIEESALRCIRCGRIVRIESCSNCGSNIYKSGIATDGSAGLFCQSCEKGFTHWRCPDCNTDNPVNTSLTTLNKGGCFIATAVYGTPYAEEVVILKTYRDNFLLNRLIGRFFVGIYYRISPYFARRISKSEILKEMIRIGIIVPLIKKIKLLFSRYL